MTSSVFFTFFNSMLFSSKTTLFTSILLFSVLLGCHASKSEPSVSVKEEDFFVIDKNFFSTRGNSTYFEGERIVNGDGKVFYKAQEGESLECYGEGFFVRRRRINSDKNDVNGEEKKSTSEFVDIKTLNVLNLELQPSQIESSQVDYCFSSGLARISEVDQQGRSLKIHFINKTGKIQETYTSDSIKDKGTPPPFSFYEGYAFTDDVDKTYKIIDVEGNLVPVSFDIRGSDLPNSSDEFPLGTAKPAALRFSEGLARVYFRSDSSPFPNLEGSSGSVYLNQKGKVAISQYFDTAHHFHEGLAVVKRDDKWFIINQDGKQVFEISSELSVERYDWAGKLIGYPDFTTYEWHGFSNGLMRVCSQETGLMGFIDRNGKVIIEPQYIYAEHFQNGISRVKKLEGQFHYINTEGKSLTKEELKFPFG